MGLWEYFFKWRKTNNPAIIDDENCVKVVTDKNNFAMYFSRSKIPFLRNFVKNFNYNIHIGVYGFLSESIIQLSSFKPSVSNAFSAKYFIL